MNNNLKFTKKLLKKFASLNAVNGFEKEINKEVYKELKLIKGLEFDENKYSTVTAIKKGNGKGPKIAIVAHVDEVGFIVVKIEKGGFLRLRPLGSWWGHVLLAKTVNIVTFDGKVYPGVIGALPPHLLKEESKIKVIEPKEMFVDLGVKDEKELKKMNIRIGNQVVPRSEWIELPNDRVISKALDNRSGVVVGIEIMRRLVEKNITHDADVMFMSATQEETNSVGAKTAVAKWKPDIVLGVDTTISTEHPSGDLTTAKLGEGLLLTIGDNIPSLANPNLIEWLNNVGKNFEKTNKKFTIQLENGPGGTDAGDVHYIGEGAYATTISMPSKYIHTHNSMMDIKDLEWAIEYVIEVIKKLDKKAYEKIEEKIIK